MRDVELELIDNLGLLYPTSNYWYNKYNKNWENYYKAGWVRALCIYHLNQRIPQVEEFIKCHLKEHSLWWKNYKRHFKIDE